MSFVFDAAILDYAAVFCLATGGFLVGALMLGAAIQVLQWCVDRAVAWFGAKEALFQFFWSWKAHRHGQCGRRCMLCAQERTERRLARKAERERNPP